MVGLPAFVCTIGFAPVVVLGAADWARLAAVALAFVASVRTTAWLGAGRFLGGAVVVVAVIIPFVSFEFARDSALADRGEEVTAIVERRHTTGSRWPTYRCRFTRLDGTRIDPTLVERRFLLFESSGECSDLRLGERVRVVHDPEGRVPPRVGDPDPDTLAIGAVGATALLAGLVLLTAIRGGSRHRRGSGSALR